ncbi:alpha beta hydrolase protein [Colletotrichum truncatum]|uniref:Alpha beta hydrolase protein n=1 Tax=Colletotrichum truncatum TaxID=5467 RepID=A0ACC3YZK2_COLTU|nr:alpha beta hydrolase protein [Colletotrichum truncatum]KAF6782082.1 alpha beta hydrolase protein [Colletotrichum truncatum]
MGSRPNISTMTATQVHSNGTKPNQELIWEKVQLTIDNTNLSISTVHREGPADPILFLHGFGSTKEDYTDINLHPSLSKYPVIAYDTPGSGSSTTSDFSSLSMPFLVAVAEAVLAHYGVKRYHLVGHSMGGLTALLLAQRNPGSVLSFTNIKGNLAPEDCFLSRQILEFPSNDPETFVEEFIERTRHSAFFGNGVYAAAFKAKVKPGAVRPTFESMVHYSDNGKLLDIFEGFPFPRMFMFGLQHATLSYLPRIAKAGVELAEIPKSGHFVMYTNPVAMWERIEDFLSRIPVTP